MNRPRFLWLALLALLALACSGCGKSPPPSTSTGTGEIPAVTAQGAVGVATKNTTRLGNSDPVVDAAAVARVVHPGLTADSRAQTVVLVSERDWPAALAASALAASPLRAPLLYSEGSTLPQISAQTLSALRPSGSSLLDGAQVITLGESVSVPNGYRKRVLTGASAAALAAALEPLVQAIHGGPPRRVLIVSAEGPPALAMPAASLAAQTGAPILFVSTNAIPAATSALLAELKQPSIYVIGPTSAVSEAVITQLGRFGQVKRINGAGTASNAIAVAQYSDGSFGWGVDEPGHGLVFTNAQRPLDAPAAASLSASGDYGPLLLLEYPNLISAELARYLSDIQPGYTDEPQCRPVRGVYNHGWLIGGQQAITAAVQAEIDSMLEISSRKACTAPPITP
ncbi:MAG: cell wall-binding repeat-containing protein [Solirubrobacteraceae bacterium]